MTTTSTEVKLFFLASKPETQNPAPTSHILADRGYNKLFSASIPICIVLLRYNLAYSSRLSIARAFNAHSELGVVEAAEKVLDIAISN